MLLRPATLDDADAIAAIYNQAVIETTASFDLEPKSVADRRKWLEDRGPRHPVIVAEMDGAVVGWGALSRYSDRAAYDATAEISVYVDARHHRRGIGRALTARLMELAVEVGLHAVIARICTENTGSIAMTRQMGFSEVGTMHEVGRKFGRWLDVAIYEWRPDPADAAASAPAGGTTRAGSESPSCGGH